MAGGNILIVQTGDENITIETTADSPPKVRVVLSSGTNLACLGDVTSIDTIRVDDNGARGTTLRRRRRANDFAPAPRTRI